MPKGMRDKDRFLYICMYTEMIYRYGERVAGGSGARPLAKCSPNALRIPTRVRR